MVKIKSIKKFPATEQAAESKPEPIEVQGGNLEAKPAAEPMSAAPAATTPIAEVTQTPMITKLPPAPKTSKTTIDPKREPKSPGKPKIKATQLPDSHHQLSEISFFYENGEEVDSSDVDEETKNQPFILIQGADCIGKAPHQCEDAYFMQDRSFGVSDGVSGWNDYGFSSDQFSLQLMYYSKQCIEKCIRGGMAKKGRRPRPSPKSSGGMRKNRSFLSMDNLDVDEDREDEAQSKNSSSRSFNSSEDSNGRRPKNERQYDSDHDQ